MKRRFSVTFAAALIAVHTVQAQVKTGTQGSAGGTAGAAVPGTGNTSAVPGVGNTSTVPGTGNTSTVPGVGNTSQVPGVGNATTIPPAIPPTNPVPPPTSPAIPSTTPVIPPATGPVNNQGVLPGSSAVNPAINPGVPGRLPPGVAGADRNDVPDVSRRTTVPPTLLRNRTNITPAQQAQINRLATELNTFGTGAALGAGVAEERLMNALAAAGNTASPVSPATMRAITSHLAPALPGTTWTPQQRQQLAIDLNMLFYSSKLSPTETQMVIDDARNSLQAAGVKPEAVETLVGDFTNLSRELQSRGAATRLPVPQAQQQ